MLFQSLSLYAIPACVATAHGVYPAAAL